MTGIGSVLISNVVARLRVMGLWHLLWISVLIAETLTAISTAIVCIIWWGRVDPDFMLMGVIDAFVASFLATIFLVLVFREFNAYEKEAVTRLSYANDMLTKEVGERLRAEELLRLSQERSRNIIDGSPIGIVVYDSQGKCVDANESIARILGGTREEILSQNFYQNQCWRDSGLLEHAIKSLNRQEHSAFAAMLTTLYGKKVYLDCYFVPFGNGELLFMVQDISARMTAEERYRAVVNLSNDGFMAAGPDGSIVDVNYAACRMTGYSREELIGMMISNIDIIESTNTVLERMEEIKREGSARFESQQRKKDGQIIDVEVSAGMFPGEDWAGATFGFIRDITERKQAERNLILLGRAVETVEVGVTITDKAGVIIYTNPAEAVMHGYEVEELLGREARLFGHGKPIGSGTSMYLEDMQHWKRERSNVKKDGTVFPVQLISNVVRDREGNPIGVITVSEDITERKQIEKRLNMLATTDSLTGCFNRRHFFELGEREFQRVARYGGHFSAMMMDIDHFKRINDSFGHPQGDAVLVLATETCMIDLRRSDILGRVGGEEFAIVFVETALDDAVRLAERIRANQAKLTLPSESGDISFTVSVGVSSGRPGDRGLEDVLKRADDALYTAKNSGRNKVVSV